MAAELVGRFETERRGFPCIALTTDSSLMTAWTNDYSYESVFSRQVSALGEKDDILLGTLHLREVKKYYIRACRSNTKRYESYGAFGKRGRTDQRYARCLQHCRPLRIDAENTRKSYHDHPHMVQINRRHIVGLLTILPSLKGLGFWDVSPEGYAPAAP